MFGKVKLYTYDYSGYVGVTTDAVVTKSDRPYLYVMKDDGTVEQREITEGETVDGIVQILSGITPGEKVVVEGEQVLSDGSKVKDITNGVSSAAADDTGENKASGAGKTGNLSGSKSGSN